jgi:hypothetical protein
VFFENTFCNLKGFRDLAGVHLDERPRDEQISRIRKSLQALIQYFAINLLNAGAALQRNQCREILFPGAVQLKSPCELIHRLLRLPAVLVERP